MGRRSPSKPTPRLRVFELLETRQVLSAATGLESVKASYFSTKVKPLATPGPTGLAPAQIAKAYGFDKVQFTTTAGGQTMKIAGDGTGTTIAIVDAYNDPTVLSDLKAFDRQFNLPDPPRIRVVNQRGGGTLPAADPGWAGEIALDVEWAHAIAPGASILLVEADSNSMADLLTAVDYARKQPGVVAISNSWGQSEFSLETRFDYQFATPAGHIGETFIFSAGDSGAPASYPSASPYVLSVGGTNLVLNKDDTWKSETTWSLATGNGAGGGGPSLYEKVPNYQRGLGITTRGTPDVSYNGDPATGVSVLSSFSDGGWVVIGGTSAGAPQWAGLLAIVAQGRSLAKRASLSNAQVAVYGLRGDFRDITSGSNGYGAGPGYDYASGLGSPIADSLIPDLVGYTASTALPPAFPPPATPGSGAWWWLNTKPIHFTAGEGAVAATSNASPSGTVTTSIDTQLQTEAATGNSDGSAIASTPSSLRLSDAFWLQSGEDSTNDSVSFSRRSRLARTVNADVASSVVDTFFAQWSGAAISAN